jgi:hypothetical protein
VLTACANTLNAQFLVKSLENKRNLRQSGTRCRNTAAKGKQHKGWLEVSKSVIGTLPRIASISVMRGYVQEEESSRLPNWSLLSKENELISGSSLQRCCTFCRKDGRWLSILLYSHYFNSWRYLRWFIGIGPTPLVESWPRASMHKSKQKPQWY